MDAFISPVRRDFALDGGTLSYLHWAGAGPALHFTHANGFNAQTYAALLTPMAQVLDIFAADLRGQGQTRLPTEPGFSNGWTRMRDDLIAFLAAVPRHPLILAGHSVGAVVSLMVAAARPDLVRGLVLIEPVFVPIDVPPELRNGNSMAERAAKRRSQFDSLEAMEEAYRGRGAFKTWPDQMLRDYLLGGTRRTPDGKVELSCEPRVEAEAFANTPFGASRLAEKIACPVTLLYGEGPGSTCSKGEVEIFVKLRPDARIVAEARATHFLPMEHPELARREILLMTERVG